MAVTPNSPAPVSVQSTPAADLVPIPQKLGYGLGIFMDMWGHWLYPTIVFQIFGLALHVSGTLLGTAIILNRLFDAVSDPFFGWLSDNTRTRFGRRRPFMLVGCLLAGVGLPFLLAVKPGGTPANYFWFMVISSALYLPMVSCFNMPYRSLGNEMTPDYHERTSVFSYQNVVKKVPELGLFFFGNFFSMAVWVGADSGNVWSRVKQLLTTTAAWRTAPDGSNPNTLLGAQVYLVLCGLIMIVVGLVCTAAVRERYYDRLVAKTHQKISIKETFWQTIQCRPFRIQIVMQLAYNLGLSMVSTLGLAATFYYVCNGDKAEGNWWNWLMGICGMVLGLLGVPTFALLARRVGKLRTMGTVLVTAIVVFIATWWLYTPKIVWLQMLATGLIAFTSAGFWMMDPSIRADVIDYDELQTGKRREGSFEACISWIGKVGMAVGAGIAFYILDWIGFNNAAAQQTPHTIFMIRFLLAAIPIVGLVIALIALSRFPLTQQRVAEIRTQLEARRGTV
ncbi:MAG TPA: MFS transporter [Opitutaceae bacterium]|nr:MFS transporter [Opitutaceae bacterium]